jgi:hypothetical protein
MKWTKSEVMVVGVVVLCVGVALGSIIDVARHQKLKATQAEVTRLEADLVEFKSYYLNWKGEAQELQNRLSASQHEVYGLKGCEFISAVCISGHYEGGGDHHCTSWTDSAWVCPKEVE